VISPRASHTYVLVTTLLLVTILLGAAAERRVPESLAFALSEIPSQLSGWSVVAQHELPAPTLRALHATAYLSRTYKRGEERLDLFMAFYAQQRAGEGMHSPKHCLPGAGWEIWKHGSAELSVNGIATTINNYAIQNAERRMLMLYWYHSKERIVASEYLGKLFLVRDTLLTGRTGGSIVRVMVEDEPGAAADSIQFASALIPQVQRCLSGR
jgi:EpsI family protein